MSTAEPPARRPLLGALVRFGLTGGLSVGVDVALLTLLHGVLDVPLALATTVAYCSSLAVNYSLNHRWVFAAEGDHRRRLLRYGALVVVNYLTTLTVVTGLAAVGVYYLVAKALVVGGNALLNFLCFRYWVFTASDEVRELVAAPAEDGQAEGEHEQRDEQRQADGRQVDRPVEEGRAVEAEHAGQRVEAQQALHGVARQRGVVDDRREVQPHDEQ